MRHLPDARLYYDTQYCLDFAKTITPVDAAPTEPVVFHFYWRGGFSRKILFALNSFLVTQDLSQVALWLWIDSATDGFQDILRKFEEFFGTAVTVKPYHATREANGTPLEGNAELLGIGNAVAASDAMRLLVLYRYGGVYVDADTMALRDFTPLLRSPYGRGEFGYRWSAKNPFATNAVARGKAGSALGLYWLEKSRQLNSCRARLLMRHDSDVPDDFLELPCVFFDPLWPHVDKADRFLTKPFSRFRDFFRPFGLFHRRNKNIAGMTDFFSGAFAYQWHGLWKMADVRNSYFGLFEQEIEAILARRFR